MEINFKKNTDIVVVTIVTHCSFNFVTKKNFVKNTNECLVKNMQYTFDDKTGTIKDIFVKFLHFITERTCFILFIFIKSCSITAFLKEYQEGKNIFAKLFVIQHYLQIKVKYCFLLCKFVICKTFTFFQFFCNI